MSFIWRNRRHIQSLNIENNVLKHFLKYQQHHVNSLEAGGQLFGKITLNEIKVMQVTGPYKDDTRTPWQYRSNIKSAQESIETQAKFGLVYLGEWHTHAEDIPMPSNADFSAMLALIENSYLNTSSLLLIIIGRKNLPCGLYVCSFNKQGILNWECNP